MKVTNVCSKNALSGFVWTVRRKRETGCKSQKICGGINRRIAYERAES